VACPFAAEAQQAGKVYRIGFLGGADPVGYAAQMEALHLRELAEQPFTFR
jgi:hypothetical protein